MNTRHHFGTIISLLCITFLTNIFAPQTYLPASPMNLSPDPATIDNNDIQSLCASLPTNANTPTQQIATNEVGTLVVPIMDSNGHSGFFLPGFDVAIINNKYYCNVIEYELLPETQGNAPVLDQGQIRFAHFQKYISNSNRNPSLLSSDLNMPTVTTYLYGISLIPASTSTSQMNPNNFNFTPQRKLQNLCVNMVTDPNSLSQQMSLDEFAQLVISINDFDENSGFYFPGFNFAILNGRYYCNIIERELAPMGIGMQQIATHYQGQKLFAQFQQEVPLSTNENQQANSTQPSTTTISTYLYGTALRTTATPAPITPPVTPPAPVPALPKKPSKIANLPQIPGMHRITGIPGSMWAIYTGYYDPTTSTANLNGIYTFNNVIEVTDASPLPAKYAINSNYLAFAFYEQGIKNPQLVTLYGILQGSD